MFKNAIVKTPCQAMVNGISEAQLGKPDYSLALQQHANYIKALEQCHVTVSILPADEYFPDSCFVEDPAILTAECAIITNPGADQRNEETVAIAQAVSDHYQHLNYIKSPGTLDGGDVMMVDKHFYIGLSDRTNNEGANQLIAILKQYGMTGSVVTMADMLHLKTGMSYLEHNNLLVSGEFIDNPALSSFNQLVVSDNESYAANCIWVNDTVIVPEGYPNTQQMIIEAGYDVITVDVSEFRKLDGGLSCLSLRF